MKQGSAKHHGIQHVCKTEELLYHKLDEQHKLSYFKHILPVQTPHETLQLLVMKVLYLGTVQYPLFAQSLHCLYPSMQADKTTDFRESYLTNRVKYSNFKRYNHIFRCLLIFKCLLEITTHKAYLLTIPSFNGISIFF